jgi:hypothetical protein
MALTENKDMLGAMIAVLDAARWRLGHVRYDIAAIKIANVVDWRVGAWEVRLMRETFGRVGSASESEGNIVRDMSLIWRLLMGQD